MRRSSVIDVFCGVGGLTHGFVLEGFDVVAGIDSDPSCRYAYEKNNNARFIEADLVNLSGEDIYMFYPEDSLKILIGCAPCQPFSNYTNKLKNKSARQWSLLNDFGRLVEEVEPEIISMENVPSLGSKDVFKNFVVLLKKNGYYVSWGNVYCADYGVPQMRQRLVLLASKLGDIKLIAPTHLPGEYITVEEAIGHLPHITAGEIHPEDSLHRASNMSSMNLKRIQISIPGGSWQNWPEYMLAPCHRKGSGRSYYNVYGRMEWKKIAPTITTEFTGFGNGRFGHPEQDRGLSLREGALLQTFPANYKFFKPGSTYYITHVAKNIGNAVPVELGRAIARSIRQHQEVYDR